MYIASIKSSFISFFEKGAQLFGILNDRISAFIRSKGSLWGIIVPIWAVLIYLIVYFILPGRVSADLYMYVYQPILWSSLALLAWLGWHYGLDDRPKLTFILALTALLLAFCQIAALAISGLLLGFGYSPYNHQISAVLGNMLYLVTFLAGMEIMRAYLVTPFKQRYSWISFVLVSLFLSILRISPGSFGQFDTIQSSIQIIGERLLPTLAQSMLATLLVWLGGPLASIIYFGILQLFEWLSPILPNPGWFVTAFIGVAIPAYGMVIVYNHFVAMPEEQDKDELEEKEQAKVHETGSFTSWALVALFTLVVIGFSTGLFGVHPSLIGSGSMTPNLMVGDIVVAREVPVENIKVGDVITFQEKGVTIVHRVIEIQSDAGQIIFITQGDANASADPPVLANYFKGKVIFTIPKIGWISIFVRNTLAKII